MIVLYIFLILLLIFMLYMVIPNYIARNKSNDVIKTINKNSKKSIALTFDDGPDPLYTNRLLDLLEKNNIKATFFLVARKAEENKDIVDRMKREGHGIGMHTMYHKSAWLSFPWETINEFKNGLDILKSLGLHITYYRPPWGTFNALTLKQALKNNLKIILWSVEAYDWRKSNSSANIENILLKRIKDKDIIVLHDSGGAEGAPNNTLGALESTIPKLKDLGFNFITIDEMIKG
ncbi:polysaccharide deacetylase familiy protein [Vallitalea longa]|uniref:Polysaccharide deacetylase familiy protein n=1 Tax=Vallitalea longa TaxID=2936439 RepID=A0A9W5Y9H4_9FIRM|nr:polysaccharide deacetylase family protein [Vallitalea longa]GKX28376.1 polysaccharide deacetylase familiy protein [Vallitalea longa]